MILSLFVTVAAKWQAQGIVRLRVVWIGVWTVSQECPTRVTNKNVPQEFPTRMPYKGALQECPTRVSYESVPQKCPTRMFNQSVLQSKPSGSVEILSISMVPLFLLNSQ